MEDYQVIGLLNENREGAEEDEVDQAQLVFHEKTLKSMCWNCLFSTIPYYLLNATGVFGFITFFVFAFATSDSNFAAFCAILLMFIGFFSVFELWNLGTLNTQIKWLSRLRDKFEEDVHEMQNEVRELSGENQELEDNNKYLKKTNQQLSHLRAKHSEDVDMLEKTRDELQEEKLHLHASIEKGKIEENTLKQTITKITQELNEMTNAMKRFEELRISIAEQYGDQDLELSEMLNRSRNQWNSMDKLFIDSETVVLKQLQADIEHTCIQQSRNLCIEGEFGVPERMFARFIRSLPSRYRKIWNTSGKSFQDYDLDNSGTMGNHEFEHIIRELLEGGGVIENLNSI